MKNLFDNYVTAIVFTIMMFAIVSFGVLQMQIISARHLHNAIVDIIQSSFYTVSLDEINQEIKKVYPKWYVESEIVESVNTRQSRLVTLHYNVVLPVFGIEQEGMINGYAK